MSEINFINNEVYYYTTNTYDFNPKYILSNLNLNKHSNINTYFKTNNITLELFSQIENKDEYLPKLDYEVTVLDTNSKEIIESDLNIEENKITINGLPYNKNVDINIKDTSNLYINKYIENVVTQVDYSKYIDIIKLYQDDIYLYFKLILPDVYDIFTINSNKPELNPTIEEVKEHCYRIKNNGVKIQLELIVTIEDKQFNKIKEY